LRNGRTPPPRDRSAGRKIHHHLRSARPCKLTSTPTAR
jgi:hypothetical protein